MSLGGSTSGSTVQFKSVQEKGSEILALMLGQGLEDADNPAPAFSVGESHAGVVVHCEALVMFC